MQHDVQREREALGAHPGGEGELALEGGHAGDRVRCRGLRVLDRELHAAQPGGAQPREAVRESVVPAVTRCV